MTWTYQREIGGLMRCCLASLDDAMVEYAKDHDEPPPDGYSVKCEYHDSWMTKRDGVFAWDKSREESGNA
jgi:hypothetical protein